MGHYLNHDTFQICTLSLASCLGSRSKFPSPTTGCRRTARVQVQTGIYDFNPLTLIILDLLLWRMAHHLSTLTSWKHETHPGFLPLLPPTSNQAPICVALTGKYLPSPSISSIPILEQLSIVFTNGLPTAPQAASSLDSFLEFTIGTVTRAFHQKVMKLVMLKVHNP